MRLVLTAIALLMAFVLPNPAMKLDHSCSIDSLGACQGISYQQGRIFLYGDRETGVIRDYKMAGDSLVYLNKEIKLTLHDSDIINHPTGIAWNGRDPVFIGNSIRLNAEGTQWRAMIYCVNWKGLQQTGRLDGNLLNTIEDDTCIQGTRPEYVQYKKKWYVATADYGDKKNEVRLYDPAVLQHAKKTSQKGVLFKKFSCTPWVQNLHWIADKGLLLLIQNQMEGRRWRFTYVDLARSIATGSAVIVKTIDIDRADELEGFSFLQNTHTGIAVSSSRRNNVNLMSISWDASINQ